MKPDRIGRRASGFAYNAAMLKNKAGDQIREAKKSFFGAAALILAILSGFFLGAFFLITVINISPSTFFRLNNAFASIYCIVSPLALVLSILGLLRKNDSRRCSLIALGLVVLPLLVLLWQFLSYFMQQE